MIYLKRIIRKLNKYTKNKNIKIKKITNPTYSLTNISHDFRTFNQLYKREMLFSRKKVVRKTCDIMIG